MKTNFGTTIFGLITNSAITIDADSMARHNDGHHEIFRKLHMVRRSVIACEGLGILKPFNKPETAELVPYRADQWMAEIESDPRLELKADARAILSFIETSHPFIELIRVEEVLRDFHKFQINSGKGYLAEFLVASAFPDELLVLRTKVRMEARGPEWKIVFDRPANRERQPAVNSFVRHGAGKIAQIDNAFSGKGNRYQDMLVHTNGSFMRLLNGHEVSLDELRDIVRCAIALEAKASPEQVGPPFIVATLQAGKPVSVTSYSE